MAAIMREQLKDNELSQVMKYLEEGDVPTDGDEALHVMNLSDHTALLLPGLLYRCANKINEKQKYTPLRKRIMIPAGLISRVLMLLHNDVLVGGHVGVTALTTKITDKFFWRNMHADILDYVKRCRTCALRKRAPHYKALARSWDSPKHLWEVVQCDFIGPLKTAKDGSKYTMTFIDLLTRWPEAFCTKDSTAKTAAEVFLYGIICCYGQVDQLHSDPGATFLSDLFREITHLVSVYSSDNHKTWPDLVQIALWTIRSSTSFRTGYSPFILLFDNVFDIRGK